MDSCCRACSRSDGFRRFSLYAVAEVNQELIADMIRDTSDTQVSTEDGLPQQICPDCLMTLSLAYTFRKQCRQSDAKFREFWSSRTSTQQQQQQHSQPPTPHSHPPTPFEGSYDPIGPTPIKNEMDIPDYEYSITSADNSQWVIQTPQAPAEQPLAEGAMTMVHNTDGQYYDESVAASETSESMVYPTDDPSEIGECSSSGQNLLHTEESSPERYSQRIRRQIPPEQTASECKPTDLSSTSMSAVQHHNNTEESSNPQMTAALEAIQSGMSFYKASASFNIPIASLHYNAKRRGITSRQSVSNKSYSEQQLNTALEAIKAGMSVAKASTDFNISPSTLRRHIEQRGIKIQSAEPVWNKEQMDQALEAIRAGMLRSEAAAKFNIPYPTLMKREKRCGIAYPSPAESRDWSEEQMNKALEAIRNGMSFRKAETEFNIPHGTIYQRAKVSGIFRTKVTATRATNDTTKKQLGNALKAVESGMTHALAASTFNVPRSSIRVACARKATWQSKSHKVEEQHKMDTSDTSFPGVGCVKIKVEDDSEQLNSSSQ